MRAFYLLLSLLGGLLNLSKAIEVIRRSHQSNFNFSLYTGYLFSQADALCYADPTRPVLAYIDKFADGTQAGSTRDIATISRNTLTLNVSSSGVYLDLPYKSITQKIQMSRQDAPLFSISIKAGDVDKYQITYGFELAGCTVVEPAALIKMNSTYARNVTCSGDTGSATAHVILTGVTAYGCSFVKGAAVDKTIPLAGMRIDWNYTLETNRAFRDSFPQIGRGDDASTTITYDDVTRIISLGIAFEEKDADGTNELRYSTSLLEVAQIQTDPSCLTASASRCLSCRAEYLLVNGDCVCNSQTTIEDLVEYPTNLPVQVNAPDWVKNGRFIAGKCRSMAQSGCEYQIDQMIFRNMTILLNRTVAGADIVIRIQNFNDSFNSIVQSCSGFSPMYRLEIVPFGRPKGFGKYSPGLYMIQNLPLTSGVTEYTVRLNNYYDAIKQLCQVTPLSEAATEFECQLRGWIGPSSATVSQEFNYKLNILNTSSFALGTKVEAQIVNLNSSRYFFGSVFKTDPNLRVKVLIFNNSDPLAFALPYDARFNMTEISLVEKNETLRLLWDLINPTISMRYAIADYKISAVITETPSLPYIGYQCNTTTYNNTFYQQGVMDCRFSLKNNVTFTVDVILNRKDPTVFPETISSQHVLMFEVYQGKEYTKLAGLGSTATIVIVVIVVLGMTSLICWLAYKAGAAENFNINALKENFNEAVEAGKKNFNQMIDDTKKEAKKIKEKVKEKKNELQEKLLDDDEAKETRKKKKTPINKKKGQDDDEEIIPESLKKNDISEIKIKKNPNEDSQDDLLFDIEKKKVKKTDDIKEVKKAVGKAKDGILDMLDGNSPVSKSGMAKKRKPQDYDDGEDEEVDSKKRKGMDSSGVGQKVKDKLGELSKITKDNDTSRGKANTSGDRGKKPVTKITRPDEDSEGSEDADITPPKGGDKIGGQRQMSIASERPKQGAKRIDSSRHENHSDDEKAPPKRTKAGDSNRKNQGDDDDIEPFSDDDNKGRRRDDDDDEDDNPRQKQQNSRLRK